MGDLRLEKIRLEEEKIQVYEELNYIINIIIFKNVIYYFIYRKIFEINLIKRKRQYS